MLTKDLTISEKAITGYLIGSTDSPEANPSSSVILTAASNAIKNIVARSFSAKVSDHQTSGISILSDGKWIIGLESNTVTSCDPISKWMSSESQFTKTAKASLGWAYVKLPKDVRDAMKRIRDKIDPEDLGEDGKESRPHITAKYGLIGTDPEEVMAAVSGNRGGTVRMGKTSIFQNDDGDVLKISVTSHALHALWKSLSTLENEDSFKEYIPHATLAYLKPGAGKKYKNNDDMDGMEFTFDSFVFEDKKDIATEISLSGNMVKKAQAETQLASEGTDNHGQTFTAVMQFNKETHRGVTVVKPTIIFQEKSGKTAGKWTYYLSSLTDNRKDGFSDSLMLDLGQKWVLNGLNSILTEAVSVVEQKASVEHSVSNFDVEVQEKNSLGKIVAPIKTAEVYDDDDWEFTAKLHEEVAIDMAKAEAKNEEYLLQTTGIWLYSVADFNSVGPIVRGILEPRQHNIVLAAFPRMTTQGIKLLNPDVIKMHSYMRQDLDMDIQTFMSNGEPIFSTTSSEVEKLKTDRHFLLSSLAEEYLKTNVQMQQPDRFLIQVRGSDGGWRRLPSSSLYETEAEAKLELKQRLSEYPSYTHSDFRISSTERGPLPTRGFRIDRITPFVPFNQTPSFFTNGRTGQPTAYTSLEHAETVLIDFLMNRDLTDTINQYRIVDPEGVNHAIDSYQPNLQLSHSKNNIKTAEVYDDDDWEFTAKLHEELAIDMAKKEEKANKLEQEKQLRDKQNQTYSGNVDWGDRTSLPEGHYPNWVEGSLHLQRLTSIPEGFNPTVGRDLWLPKLTSITEGFNPTVGWNLILSGLERTPKGFHPTVGGSLHLDSMFTVRDSVIRNVTGKIYLQNGVTMDGLAGVNRTASSSAPTKTAEVYDDDDWEFTANLHEELAIDMAKKEAAIMHIDWFGPFSSNWETVGNGYSSIGEAESDSKKYTEKMIQQSGYDQGLTRIVKQDGTVVSQPPEFFIVQSYVAAQEKWDRACYPFGLGVTWATTGLAKNAIITMGQRTGKPFDMFRVVSSVNGVLADESDGPSHYIIKFYPDDDSTKERKILMLSVADDSMPKIFDSYIDAKKEVVRLCLWRSTSIVQIDSRGRTIKELAAHSKSSQTQIKTAEVYDDDDWEFTAQLHEGIAGVAKTKEERQNQTYSGHLNWSKRTSLPEGHYPNWVEGNLWLSNLTSIPEGFSPNVGGSLHLQSTTSVPSGFNPIVGRDLWLPKLTSIPEGFNPTVGGGLHLQGVTSIPESFKPTVRGDLHLQSLASIPESVRQNITGTIYLKNNARIQGLAGASRSASSSVPTKTAEVYDDDDWEFTAKLNEEVAIDMARAEEKASRRKYFVQTANSDNLWVYVSHNPNNEPNRTKVEFASVESATSYAIKILWAYSRVGFSKSRVLNTYTDMVGRELTLKDLLSPERLEVGSQYEISIQKPLAIDDVWTAQLDEIIAPVNQETKSAEFQLRLSSNLIKWSELTFINKVGTRSDAMPEFNLTPLVSPSSFRRQRDINVNINSLFVGNTYVIARWPEATDGPAVGRLMHVDLTGTPPVLEFETVGMFSNRPNFFVALDQIQSIRFAADGVAQTATSDSQIKTAEVFDDDDWEFTAQLHEELAVDMARKEEANRLDQEKQLRDKQNQTYSGNLDWADRTSLPEGHYPNWVEGNLLLSSLTSIPEGFNPTVGGHLDLFSLTSIPASFNPVVRGNLWLHNLNTIPEGFNPTVEGHLILSRATSVPASFNPTVGGDLVLSNLIHIPRGFNPTVGRDFVLTELTSIPDGFSPTVGKDLYLTKIKSVPDSVRMHVTGYINLKNAEVVGGLAGANRAATSNNQIKTAEVFDDDDWEFTAQLHEEKDRDMARAEENFERLQREKQLRDKQNQTYIGTLDWSDRTSLPEGHYPNWVQGSLDLNRLTSIPEGFNPTVGENLWLNRLTSIPEGFNPTVGENLWLNRLTSIPSGFNPTVGGNLYLHSLTSIPSGFNPTVGGNLDLRGLTSIPEGFNPTVGGDLNLSNLTSIPKGFNPTVGRTLWLQSLTSIPASVRQNVAGIIHLENGEVPGLAGSPT